MPRVLVEPDSTAASSFAIRDVVADSCQIILDVRVDVEKQEQETRRRKQ